MHKLTKSQALYLYRPGQQYRCEECAMLKDLPKGKYGCAFVGPADPVNRARGGCGMAVPGTAPKNVPWIGLLTKQEIGYAEALNGFSCKRCEYFSTEKSDCLRVDKNSPGDTPGRIDPNSCCALQEADKRRGQLSTEAVLKVIAERSRPSVEIAVSGGRKRG